MVRILPRKWTGHAQMDELQLRIASLEAAFQEISRALSNDGDILRSIHELREQAAALNGQYREIALALSSEGALLPAIAELRTLVSGSDQARATLDAEIQFASVHSERVEKGIASASLGEQLSDLHNAARLIRGLCVSLEQAYIDTARVVSEDGPILRAIHELGERLGTLESASLPAIVAPTDSDGRQNVERELDRLRRSENVWQRELMLLAARLHRLENGPDVGEIASDSRSEGSGMLDLQTLGAIVSLDENVPRRTDRLLANLSVEQTVFVAGVGLGEHLEALRSRWPDLVAVERDHTVAEFWRTLGVPVVNEDPRQFLARQDDGTVESIVSIHFAEQIPDAELLAFLVAAHRALRPAGRIVLELFDPGSMSALREMLARGGLPLRILHPDRARALLLAAGFHRVSVERDTPGIADEVMASGDTGRYLILAIRTDSALLSEAADPAEN